ncbi:MAG: hypothetical protein WAO37_08725, partial [Thermacetogeniaceae bacterium]
VMTDNMLPEQGLSGLIHGVNVSFFVAGISSLIGLVLAFSIKTEKKKSISDDLLKAQEND